MSTGSSLRVSNVTKYYKNFLAVDRANLFVENGEFLTILGPSGSGKTTLLKLIAGFEELSEGDILLNDQAIAKMKAFQRDIGMVFQNYALFPHMTVFENVAYPLKIRKWSKKEILSKVNEVLNLVQLKEYSSRYPKQLSGGQQQRVALARAIVFNPPLLLLDEPLSALDKNLRQQMQLEIKHIQEKVGITTISVTHDQEEALTMSDRICVMNQGKIEQIDTPKELYTHPANRFVATFIGEINLLEGVVCDHKNGVTHVKLDHDIHVPVDAKENFASNRLIGEQRDVAIRPENIRIATEKGQYETTLSVKLVEKIYMGEAIKVKATTSFGGQEITIKIPSVESSRLNGDELLIGWNREDATLVESETNSDTSNDSFEDVDLKEKKLAN